MIWMTLRYLSFLISRLAAARWPLFAALSLPSPVRLLKRRLRTEAETVQNRSRFKHRTVHSNGLTLTREIENKNREFSLNRPKLQRFRAPREFCRYSWRLLLRRQLVAVRRECFTEGIAGAAAGRILVTRTAGFSRCRSVCRQGLCRFGSSDRQRCANCERRNDGAQDFQIHLSSPLMDRMTTPVLEFSRERFDLDQQ